jgi:hypothetical protein
LDSAFANGAGSIAGAGYGNFDTALANGTDSGGLAGGVIVNNTTLVQATTTSLSPGVRTPSPRRTPS